jgi:hypothetical protein
VYTYKCMVLANPSYALYRWCWHMLNRLTEISSFWRLWSAQVMLTDVKLDDRNKHVLEAVICTGVANRCLLIWLKPHLLLAPHVKRLHVRPCTPSRGRAAAGVPQVSQICKSLWVCCKLYTHIFRDPHTLCVQVTDISQAFRKRGVQQMFYRQT